jgi:hypothetical protein
MSEKLFKAGQSLTRAYKKFDDFAQKGLIQTLKEKYKGKTPISTGPVLSKSKAVTVFDPKKALPSKLPSAAKKVGKFGTLKKVGRIASRVALPVTAGFEAANLAYKVATLSPEKKAKVKKLKKTLKKKSTKEQHADLLKMRLGGDTMKKIPEGPKGEGLRKLKAERPDVTKKMGFAKKGKMLKASFGMLALMKKAKDKGAKPLEFLSPAAMLKRVSGRKMGGKMLKARYGTMAKGNVKEGLKKSDDFKFKLESFEKDSIRKLRGAQVGPVEEAKLRSMMPNLKDSPSKRKSKMTAVKMKLSKLKVGGEMRGFGAARTSGMGLQDEELVPGKSLDYYKDLM